MKSYSAQEQGRRNAQEETERRLRELRDEMEREHQQALHDEQERAIIEHEEQREQLDRQRRERETRESKRREEERLLQLRLELLNYDFHKCPRIKKEAFQNLDVDDIDLIHIALIGPTGSGKTALVGTLQRAIGENQTAFAQGTGREGNIILEEYFVQKDIRIVDTRGFFARDEKLQDEVLDIITGRIRLGEEIKRDYDDPVNQSRDEFQELNTMARKTAAFSKCIHAVILVLKANDPRLEEGIYKGTLQKIRDHFRTHGIYPVTVITFLDMLKAEEVKKKASEEAGLATGGPGGRTYFITNYTHENNKTSFAVERTALDILDSALVSAESFIRIRKQRERNQMEREAMAGGASSDVVTVEQFFAHLKTKHHWTHQGKMKAVLEDLRRKEINTVKALKELWDDVKSELPLSTGMKKIMEEEIKTII